MCLGLWVWGAGVSGQRIGLRVEGLGVGVQGFMVGVRVQECGVCVEVLGFRVSRRV